MEKVHGVLLIYAFFFFHDFFFVNNTLIGLCDCSNCWNFMVYLDAFDESLFSSIPLHFVYPFDSCSVLNCSSLVCFQLLGFIRPLFRIWTNFTLFGLIFVFNYF